MQHIPIVKYQGYGNDYIILESQHLNTVSSIDEVVKRICDRHYGVGSDGVALIHQTNRPDAHFTVRIFNADGGEAAMSGNGTRCAAAHLYQSGLWSDSMLRLNTKSGVKTYRLLEREAPGHFKFEAEIGRPQFESDKIPFKPLDWLERVMDFPLKLSDEEVVRITALQMCNPNCVLFVDDLNRLDWRRIGREIERHPLFPERTNVEFVRVIDRGRIEAKVWERGVGETLSSGTGASAAAVGACINNFTESKVEVVMPGGTLHVEWRAEDGEVLLTGVADLVFHGEWESPVT